MSTDHARTHRLAIVSLASFVALAACSDDGPSVEGETGESSQTDGDGDGDSGDGDGDSGDGDGDPGDGDGDSGDGDGDSGDGDGDSGDGDGDPPDPVCGDGQVDEGEACDDGNADNTDDCLDSCEAASCGDGYIWADNETCDDGNAFDHDGCDATCTPSVGAMKVATGYEFTCVLNWEGQVKCWGYNGYGQLGRGDNVQIGDDEVPADSGFVDLGGVAVDIAAGGDHTCALLDDADVVCWGRNSFGQLGYGNTDWIGNDESPATAGPVSVGGSAVELRVGLNHSCVLTDQQRVRCWGLAGSGQLGQGNMTIVGDDELPSSIPSIDLGGDVETFTTGARHGCALLTNGEVRCWGNNAFGTLGQGNTIAIGTTQPPVDYPPVSLGDTPVVELQAGFLHTCARYEDNTIRCWGTGEEGQLGYADTQNIGDDELPSSMPVVDVGGEVDEIYLNFYNTCARLGTEVKCWGRGLTGANGYGHVEPLGDDEAPSSYGFVDVGIPVAGLSQGGLGFHVCAHAGESVRCWGRGLEGQLGYGNTDLIGDSETPASIGDVAF